MKDMFNGILKIVLLWLGLILAICLPGIVGLTLFLGPISLSNIKPAKGTVVRRFINCKDNIDEVFDYFESLDKDIYIYDNDGELICYKYERETGDFEDTEINDEIIAYIDELEKKKFGGWGKRGNTFYTEVTGKKGVGIVYLPEGGVPNLDYVVKFEPIEGYEGYYFYETNFEKFKQGYGVFEKY